MNFYIYDGKTAQKMQQPLAMSKKAVHRIFGFQFSWSDEIFISEIFRVFLFYYEDRIINWRSDREEKQRKKKNNANLWIHEAHHLL